MRNEKLLWNSKNGLKIRYLSLKLYLKNEIIGDLIGKCKCNSIDVLTSCIILSADSTFATFLTHSKQESKNFWWKVFKMHSYANLVSKYSRQKLLASKRNSKEIKISQKYCCKWCTKKRSFFAVQNACYRFFHLSLFFYSFKPPRYAHHFLPPF